MPEYPKENVLVFLYNIFWDVELPKGFWWMIEEDTTYKNALPNLIKEMDALLGKLTEQEEFIVRSTKGFNKLSQSKEMNKVVQEINKTTTEGWGIYVRAFLKMRDENNLEIFKSVFHSTLERAKKRQKVLNGHNSFQW